MRKGHPHQQAGLTTSLERAAVVLILAGSASCAAKSGASPAADLVRSQKLAEALASGVGQMTPVPGTMKLGFAPEAVQAGQAGSAIIAFVVLPNGRVDRDSRTLVYVEGHQIFAKYACDALLAARFEPVPSDRRGAVGTFPVFFYIREGPPRDTARVRFQRANMAVQHMLRTLTFDEGLTWFQARPPCSAIRIGIEPLYGPPP